MLELVAIAYMDETLADRAIEELWRDAEQLAIDPDRAAVLICERDGSCRLTTSRHDGATAGWSGFWATLLDELLDDEHSAALDAGFRRRLRSLLRPGTSMLLVAAPPAGARSVAAALSQFGGERVGCELADRAFGPGPAGAGAP